MGRMDEATGRSILKRRFELAGFPITESYAFEEGGVKVEIDGFDPKSDVGYEYLTSAAGDRDDVSAEEIATLRTWHERGRLHLLIVDERDGLDAEGLERVADVFLAELRLRYGTG